MKAGALSIVLLAFGALACERNSQDDLKSSLPNWEDIPASSADGPRFEDEDFSLEVRAPHFCNVDSPLGPPHGQRRLSVPLKIRGKSTRPVPLSALTFALQDAQGHVHRPTLAGCAPALKQQELKKGETVVGEVAFDVPEDIGAVQLLFEPFLMGRKAVRARVEVPAPAPAPGPRPAPPHNTDVP